MESERARTGWRRWAAGRPAADASTERNLTGTRRIRLLLSGTTIFAAVIAAEQERRQTKRLVVSASLAPRAFTSPNRLKLAAANPAAAVPTTPLQAIPS